MFLPMFLILAVLLMIACWQDFHDYRIKNNLIVTGAVLGIALNTFLFAETGFLDSLIGLGFGLLLLLPFYLLRIMGAGDVKLLAMIGAFVGQNDILWVFLYTLVAGGLLALVFSLWQGRLRRMFDNVILTCLPVLSVSKSECFKDISSFSPEVSQSAGKLPYAIAITAGTGFFLTLKHFQ
ncbi:MAG: hypothetical protein EBU46_02185 [Nitrosomonadaceae bacterium]|nr:hypothetical protein [Nitrosomonadaceae bacterium]